MLRQRKQNTEVDTAVKETAAKVENIVQHIDSSSSRLERVEEQQQLILDSLRVQEKLLTKLVFEVLQQDGHPP